MKQETFKDSKGRTWTVTADDFTMQRIALAGVKIEGKGIRIPDLETKLRVLFGIVTEQAIHRKIGVNDFIESMTPAAIDQAIQAWQVQAI